MVLMHHQTFQDLERISCQIDQVLDRSEAGLENSGISTHKIPVIELNNTSESLSLKVMIPGLERDDLNLKFTRESIIISGDLKHQFQDEDYENLKPEDSSQKFRKVIALPDPVEKEQVSSDYRNGILTLILPKAH